MKLFTRSFLIIGLFLFGTQAVLAVPLNACTPQAILDYSGQNIPAGSNCTLAPTTIGAPGVPFSFTTPNFGDSTPAFSLPVNTSGSNINYTYTLSCQGSGATPKEVTFTVPPNTGCNQTPPPAQKYDCGNLCRACDGTSQPACSGNTSTVAGCTGQSCSGTPYNPPAGTITGDIALSISAPNASGQCTVTGSASTGISSGVTTKKAQIRTSGNISELNSAGDIGSNPLPFGQRGIPTGTSLTGTLGVADSFSGPSIQTLDSQTVTCTAAPLLCGNSVTDLGEQCDLGSQNGFAGSGCSRTCQTTGGATCGNGIVEPPEQCDPGSGQGWSTRCSLECVLINLDRVYAFACPSGIICNGVNTAESITPTCGESYGIQGYPTYDACLTQLNNLIQNPVALLNYCPGQSVSLNVTASTPVDSGNGDETVISNITTTFVRAGRYLSPTGEGRLYSCKESGMYDFQIGTLNPCEIGFPYLAFQPPLTVVSKPFTLSSAPRFYGGIAMPAGGNEWRLSDIQCSVVPSANTGAIDIGWDTSSYTKSKSVPFADQPNTLYVNTGGRTGCSVSGNFESANTAGINMPIGSNPSFSMGPSYRVENRPVGTYRYALSCSGVVPVTATLTVTPAAQSSVTCNPSSQSLSNGSATINWATTLTDSPTCNVNGTINTGIPSGSFSVTSAGNYSVSCTDRRGATGNASCSVTNAPPAQYKCVNNSCAICDPNGDRVGCTTFAACQTSCGVTATDDAVCIASGITASPQPVLSGKPFSISFGFTNIGGTRWNIASYNTLRVIGGTTFGTFGSPLFLTQDIAGLPTRATALFGASLTAPILTAGSVPTRFPLAYQMNNTSKGVFGAQCEVAGGGVLVRNPQCNDGINNDGSEDSLVDCQDPGCWPKGVVNGPNDTCDTTDDNEADQRPEAVLKITANPQLVRQGGSSTVTYEVNKCVDDKGNTFDWKVQEVGSPNASVQGSGTSNGPQPLPIINIQSKKTFVLSCGGTSRSATISVIKINEF